MARVPYRAQLKDIKKTKGSPFSSIFSSLASLKLTLICLGLMMTIVFFGTLDQVHLGTFAAQKKYFDAFIVKDFSFFGIPIPYFPGGLGVGALWLLNLVAAHGSRFSWKWKKAGILITHAGLIVLILGQFFSQQLSSETQMRISEGETKQYSESPRKFEIVLINETNPQFDEVTSIPEPKFSHQGEIKNTGLPFKIVVRKFFSNAFLQPGMTSQSLQATRGIGTGINIIEMPSMQGDDQVNNVSAFVEIFASGASQGIWLLSSALGAEQTFIFGENVYKIALRPERHYMNTALTLKEFKHDYYLGTQIPKNFSSLIALNNLSTGEKRDTLIYMNHPLRLEGKTFYQSSFSDDGQVSILHVVENPVWLTPYIASLLVALGLLLQFSIHLISFLKNSHEK